MPYLAEVSSGKIGLLAGPHSERSAMLRIAAALALDGPVSIMDGGNSFDAYQVARHVRRQTPRLIEVLDRISVARAFTSYQVVTLLEQTPDTPAPKLALDLLATFCDESVSVVESERLLGLVIVHLRRLRRNSPVMVSIQPPPQPERAGLVQILRRAADRVYIRESPAVPVAARLFY